MKRIFFLLTAALVVTAASAQSEKYMKVMESLVPAVDTTRDPANLLTLAHSFERIANAEKTQWLPYYYAVLSHVNMANEYFVAQKASMIDAVLDKAEPMLKAALALEKDNSELLLLKKMFNSARMMVDPMNRYMSFGMEAQSALQSARALNPGNPRIYLMEGIDKFYTPEQFGGSRAEGLRLFREAEQKYAEWKPASSIHPDWGRPMLRYFLSEATK